MAHVPRSPSAMAAAVALIALACHGDHVTPMTPVAYCTATAPVAISVDVRDAASGRPLADSAKGTLRSGAATDTLLRRDSLTLFGGRQTGTYDVVVQRPGYRDWSRTGVAAMQVGACGNVVTVPLSAQLQPAP